MTLPIGSPKPSELMLKGYAQTGYQQATGQLYDPDTGAACALGATYLGFGVSIDALRDDDFDSDELDQRIFDEIRAHNPTLNESAAIAVQSVIMSLNDGAKWTIPQIANWLRTALAL